MAFFNSLECTYKQFRSEKMVGIFNLGTPNLVIHDVELAKQIMVKDFDHFVDRRDFGLSETNEVI